MTYTIEDIIFRSGDLFLPKPLLRYLEYYWIGNDTSLVYVNNWSLVHFFSGILTVKFFRYMEIKKDIILLSFLLHCVWELWQILGKNTRIWTIRGQIDVVLDTLFFMSGVYLALSFKEDTK